MKQKLEYINQGRGGYVIYKDGHNDIKLFFEYGGGNCVAIIYVPTIKEWTSRTNRPQKERLAILTFVANQVIQDKSRNCYYELSDTYIEILRKAT